MNLQKRRLALRYLPTREDVLLTGKTDPTISNGGLSMTNKNLIIDLQLLKIGKQPNHEAIEIIIGHLRLLISRVY